MRNLDRSLTLASAFVLAGCGATKATDPASGVAPPPARTASASALIGGHAVTIAPYLWRDYMPITPPDGRSLIVTIRAYATDGTPLPVTVSADSLWVISADDVWAAAAVQEQPRSSTGAALEVVARNGPKWAPGTAVDVVLRMHDGGGPPIYLRVVDERIVRTE